MAKTTIVFGVLLIGVGLFAYFGSSPKVELLQEETSRLEGASPISKKLPITALIPAFFGTPLLASFFSIYSRRFKIFNTHKNKA